MVCELSPESDLFISQTKKLVLRSLKPPHSTWHGLASPYGVGIAPHNEDPQGLVSPSSHLCTMSSAAATVDHVLYPSVGLLCAQSR